MGDWIKRQLTVQNILLVGTLASTLSLNTGRWVTNLSTENRDRAIQMDQVSRDVQALTNRVDVLERTNYQLGDVIAKDFPRRSELEPRLKAIEDHTAEQTLMIRRMMENYSSFRR